MRKLITLLVAAMFASVALSAIAADEKSKAKVKKEANQAKSEGKQRSAVVPSKRPPRAARARAQ